MRYKVGDKVRVRSDLQISRRYGSYMFASGMDHYKGSVVTISKEQQSLYFYCIEEDEGSWIWAEEMFEGLAEDELTAEEAIRLKCKMCESISCSECKFSRLNNGENLFCNKFLEKYTEQVVEILKQWKKDHEKKEIETEFVNIVRVIEDLGDSKRCVYEEDVTEVKDETFKMAMKRVLEEYCKDHEGKFFTVYEETCRVKEQP